MTTRASSARGAVSRAPWGFFVTVLLSLLLTGLIVAYPKDSLEASLFGLELWFGVVFPALFPFFTMSEILMGLGVIHGAGVLLEPAMRPLFRIPGVGGFVVAIGLASGYPLGAKITGQVCRDGLCSPVEGERLISFANTADPLFLVGAQHTQLLCNGPHKATAAYKSNLPAREQPQTTDKSITDLPLFSRLFE